MVRVHVVQKLEIQITFKAGLKHEKANFVSLVFKLLIVLKS